MVHKFPLRTCLLLSVATLGVAMLGVACKPAAPPPQQPTGAASGLDLSFMEEGSRSPAASEKPAAKGWDPCGAKDCGAPCTQCDPLDDQCVEVMVEKQCNASKQCVASPASCDGKSEEGAAKPAKSKKK
mgnify:CR=1 FL=1